MTLKIYTRTGDEGLTGLFGGGRVPKDDARVDAYGDVDELNATLGLARSIEMMPRIDDERIGQLERAIDQGEAELEPLKAFIVPGGTPKSAALHVARTVCRRAERKVVHLRHDVPEIPLLVVQYLNRLSDLLFVLARVANRRAGAGEVTW